VTHTPRFSPRASDASPRHMSTDGTKSYTPTDENLPSALCTTGTYADKAREAVAYSERHRKLATQRRRLLRDVEARGLTRRRDAAEMSAPSDVEIETITDARVAADPIWKSHIGDERWGNELAATYAALDAAETQRELLRYLRSPADRAW
jgi:hypothetical protein